MEITCPLCGSQAVQLKREEAGSAICNCTQCDLAFVRPQTKSDLARNPVSQSHEFSFQPNSEQLFLKETVRANRQGIIIGRLSAEFANFCNANNRQLTHIREPSKELALFNPGSYGFCVVNGVLESTPDIQQLLCQIRAALIPEGILFLLTSSSRRWSSETRFRFNPQTIAVLLTKLGYHRIHAYPQNDVLLTISRKGAAVPNKDKVSVIVPVFNEKTTFSKMMAELCAKELKNVDKEIVIVESNSTDGTREEVLRFQGIDGIKVILEDRPWGKGHAVRAGIKEATGDIILIQDADLEYKVADYDDVLEPLLKHQRMFVLGSRHTGNWKMRQFGSDRFLSAYVNFGHVVLTGVINLLHGSKLKDPFTMYKVFRRDCLYGIQLESNGFDLDWELVIKFLRKKYFPLEVPVAYSSRSFNEGKKIHIFKDPLRGLRALVKFRFCKFRLNPE